VIRTPDGVIRTLDGKKKAALDSRRLLSFLADR
jgi:hypothetical protein